VQEDHPLGFGGEVRQADQAAALWIAALLEGGGGQPLRPEQRRERPDADALRRAPEQLAPRHLESALVLAVHGMNLSTLEQNSGDSREMLQLNGWLTPAQPLTCLWSRPG
jgi:hypothetical protein